jgi:hypothetical protein
MTHSADTDHSSLTYRSGGYYSKYFYRGMGYSSGLYKAFLTITYTPSGGADTTPPASITGLINTTYNCENVSLQWSNPLDADFNDTIWRKNGIITAYTDNVTTSYLFEGLSELTTYTFSSKTCDIIGNCNTTFVNLSVTTAECYVPPTPTPTPTLSPSGNFIYIWKRIS